MSDNEIDYGKYGERITPEEARAFSEGNEQLYQLLMLCIDKNIVTYACCAGHFFDDYEKFIDHLYTPRLNKTREEFKKDYPIMFCDDAYFSINVDDNDRNLLCCLLESERLNNDFMTISTTNARSADFVNHTIGFRMTNKNGGFHWTESEFDNVRTNFFNNLITAINEYDSNKKYTSNKLRLYRLLSKNFFRSSCTYYNNDIKFINIPVDAKLDLTGFENNNLGYNISMENKANKTVKQVLDELKASLN